MAAHLRTQYRLAMEALLVGAINADGDVVNVFTRRAHAIDERELPALFMAQTGEDANAETMRKPFLNDVTIDLDLQLAVKDDSHVDDVIDDVCKQIQHRIAGAASIGGAKWVKYRRTRIYRDEDNQDVLRADLSFTAYFIAAEDAVDTAL